ncbi:uncharacterized protein LOC121806753 [Salvia splendens]|uniref:uncharacterized protein LOC121806753 n=1 Tax=Salvia splendens TaxID=180675 RepID=UPI001C27647F|nr:uncharacterized protein LOC121806753 [Salvia splendens]
MADVLGWKKGFTGALRRWHLWLISLTMAVLNAGGTSCQLRSCSVQLWEGNLLPDLALLSPALPHLSERCWQPRAASRGESAPLMSRPFGHFLKSGPRRPIDENQHSC